MKDDTIWFRWDGYPEAQSKSGKRTQLHYHFLIDGSGIAETSVQFTGTIALTAWEQISHRRWGHVPHLDLRRARSKEAVDAYIRKHDHAFSPLAGHSVHLSSDRKPRREWLA